MQEEKAVLNVFLTEETKKLNPNKEEIARLRKEIKEIKDEINKR